MKHEKERTFAPKPWQLEYLCDLQYLSGFYLLHQCILINKTSSLQVVTMYNSCDVCFAEISIARHWLSGILRHSSGLAWCMLAAAVSMSWSLVFTDTWPTRWECHTWVAINVCHTYDMTDVIRPIADLRYDLFTTSVVNLWLVVRMQLYGGLFIVPPYYFFFLFQQLFIFSFTRNMHLVQCSNIK